MLTTLNTGNLSPRQIDRAEEWLEDWCRHIVTDQSYDDSRHRYCVDIDGDAGPVRITPGLHKARVVFLRTTHLHRDIVAAQRYYLDKSLSSSLGLYTTNPLREYLELLDQLRNMWSAAPSQAPGRASARTEARPGTVAEVVQGFENILALVGSNNGASQKAVEWSIRERSERGLGMAGPAQGEGMPRTQQVIAVRWQGATKWQIGVVVRAITQQVKQVCFAGVRLLSAEAIVLELKVLPGRNSDFDRVVPAEPGPWQVFFLAGNERSGQADSLLCRPGGLAPGMRLLLSTDKNEFSVEINRLIEGTADWQRVGFLVLDKRAAANR